jgi:hypothetical protein
MPRPVLWRHKSPYRCWDHAIERNSRMPQNGLNFPPARLKVPAPQWPAMCDIDPYHTSQQFLRRDRPPVPWHVKCDDAELPSQICVCELMAPHKCIAVCRVEHDEWDARAALFVEGAVWVIIHCGFEVSSARCILLCGSLANHEHHPTDWGREVSVARQ